MNLPKGWIEQKFSDVAKVVTGNTPKTFDVDNYGGDLPFITPSELKSSEAIINTPITISKKGETQARIIPENAVLVCCIGSLGKVGITGRKSAFNQQINALIFDSEQVYYRYGYHYCRTLKPILEHFAPSTTVPIVNKGKFQEFKIPLPPIASQRRIADILDKADEIIRKRKDAIALTEQLQKSIFLDMFGDPVTNPKGWEVVELGKLIIGKPNNGIFRKNDEYGGKIPVIWVKELFSGSILNSKNSISLDPTEQEIKKFGLKKGDLLFCRSSLKLEGIGYNNVFDDEDDSALFECHIIRVSPNQSKINSIFLNYLLRTEGMRKVIISKSNTVTMSTIGQEQIKTILVILPPKNIQDDFDKQSRYLINLIAKKQIFLQESENLFNSLLQRAFKGEL